MVPRRGAGRAAAGRVKSATTLAAQGILTADCPRTLSGGQLPRVPSAVERASNPPPGGAMIVGLVQPIYPTCVAAQALERRLATGPS
eukprot:COSAG01_NODE_1992_length_8696_cov_4.370827_2_plen_87_part_00